MNSSEAVKAAPMPVTFDPAVLSPCPRTDLDSRPFGWSGRGGGPVPYEAAGGRYEDMSYRRCGRSGLRLPGISLGLWHNFGDDRPYEVGRGIVRRAFDLGITHFD